MKNCTNTLDFIKHIFGDHYELGLDYIQILYTNPNQKLPVLKLISTYSKTGKTTFIKFLKAIFSDDCAILHSAFLNSSFNQEWASKLIIAVEESFIEKQSIIERIKELSLSDNIRVNERGENPKIIPFRGKFILSSNVDFILGESSEYRVLSVNVPLFEGKERVNLLNEMIQEIPEFLSFLKTRKLNTPDQKSRLWFDPSDLSHEL